MALFSVEFDVRHANGSFEVEADSEEAAEEIVRNKPIPELIAASSETFVEIETVTKTEDE